MDLTVTNITIDGYSVYEASWVKSNGVPVVIGDTFDSSFNLKVDEYTLDNPGKTTVITVNTKGTSIYKDMVFTRCLPDCKCDSIVITKLSSGEYISKNGGSVIFSYGLNDDSQCGISDLECKSIATYVTIEKDESRQTFTVKFARNTGLQRTARIVFVYNNKICDYFNVTQDAKDGAGSRGGGDCVEWYTIICSSNYVECGGGTVTLSVEGEPPMPEECDNYYNLSADTQVTCDGGEVTFTIDGGGSDTDFTTMVKSFNTVLRGIGVTEISETSTPVTYAYLNALYDEAVSTFNNESSDLFKKSTYAEIYDYRTGSTTNHELGFSAMASWLMAMQISEIVSNSGTSTNNQTKIFKKAYDIGGGRSAPVYGYSDLRSDVNICRLAASAIYAKNKSRYGFTQIDTMRNELGTTVNNRNTTWKDFGYSTSDDGNICNNTLSINVGYACALNDILPAAAGPYATWYYFNGGCTPTNPTSANRQPDPLQPSSQFNHTTKNYKVDEAIYDTVTTNYNLVNNNSYIARSVQAIADDSLDTEDLFGNTTYYKYNTSSPRYTFVAGSPSDNNGNFKSVFNSGVTLIDLSTFSSDENAFGFFIHGVGSMSDNSKKTLGDKQYGRRRPSQGETDTSARCVCGGGYSTLCVDCTDTGCTRMNYLNDTSIERLIGTGTRRDGSGNVYYVDLNGNAYYDNGEPYYGETYVGTANECAQLNSTTYPSGHSARIWGIALILMGMIPNRWLEIYKAAYAFTVSRTIVRAHWNSDIIFGKLLATTFIPTVYSFNDSSDYNFRTLYNNAKQIIDR